MRRVSRIPLTSLSAPLQQQHQRRSYIAVKVKELPRLVQPNRRLVDVHSKEKLAAARATAAVEARKRATYTSCHSKGVTTSGGAAHLQSITQMVELEAQGYNASQPRHQSTRRGLGPLSQTTSVGAGPSVGIESSVDAEMGTPSIAHKSFSKHTSRIDIARAKAPSLKAVWNTTENWCSLCKEPLNSWNEHRGKRDHVCLEMFYDQLVEYASNWSTDARGNVTSYFSEKIFSTDKCMSTYGNDELKRRAELLIILKYLFDEGLLKRGKQFAASNEFVSAQTHGALALYKHQYIPLSAMFPFATAAHCSSLSQMCASLYNMETVFDLCGLRELTGNDAPQQGTIMTPKGEVPDVGYSYKGTFLRSIIGQLRFALDPGSVEPPRYEKRSQFGFVPSSAATQTTRKGKKSIGIGGSGGGGGDPIPAHMELLAKIACKTLIAEMVFCRTCEFMCRVEPVWRDHVNSANPPRPAMNLPNTLPPKLSNYGAYCYLDGALHNPVVVEAPFDISTKAKKEKEKKPAAPSEGDGSDGAGGVSSVAQRLAATRGVPRLTMTSGGRYGKLEAKKKATLAKKPK